MRFLFRAGWVGNPPYHNSYSLVVYANDKLPPDGSAQDGDLISDIHSVDLYSDSDVLHVQGLSKPFRVRIPVTNVPSAKFRCKPHQLQPLLYYLVKTVNVFSNFLSLDVQCAFITESNKRSSGSSAWSGSGCKLDTVEFIDANCSIVTCLCSHLTDFGVLFGLGRYDIQPKCSFSVQALKIFLLL